MQTLLYPEKPLVCKYPEKSFKKFLGQELDLVFGESYKIIGVLELQFLYNHIYFLDFDVSIK
nr:hypothetical protein CPBEC1_23580 [Clostridium perfringens]